MQRIVTLKMTEAELDILDWLMARLDRESRSDALRHSVVELARTLGLASGPSLSAMEERLNHPPRRCPKLTRLIGGRKGAKKRDPQSGESSDYRDQAPTLIERL